MANTIDNMDEYGAGWFKMDESSGNVTDSKGTAIGTINGGVTRVEGYDGQGKALNFNGTNGYVQFNQKVIPLGAKSIRFKIKKNGFPTGYQTILATAQDPTEYGIVLALSSISGQRLYVNSTKAGWSGFFQAISIPDSYNIFDNQWHEVLFTWDGLVGTGNVKLYIDDMYTPISVSNGVSVETIASTHNLLLGRSPFPSTNYFNGQLDSIEIYNEVISPNPDKTLLYHNGLYKYFNYSTTSWQTIGSTVTQIDYINSGMEDISLIPESAWSELVGDVELCYWSDFQPKTEIQFDVETEPFSLLEKWDGKQIQVIEYTDNPDQEESSVTLNTEPFMLEDELKQNGDTFDVLYYTDDANKTSAELNLNIGYSPLDELPDEFEVVTYVDGYEEGSEVSLNMNALPKEQFLTADAFYYGNIQSIVSSITSNNKELSLLRFVLSFDSGVTWQSYRNGYWKTINTNEKYDIRRYAMTYEELNSIRSDKFISESMKIGYYLEERVWNDENLVVDDVLIKSSAYVDDVKISDLAFYVLNTTATINLEFKGNKLTGVLDDEDQTRVQYRVFLNEQPYYPIDGSFSRLAAPPLNINLNISEKDIVFGQDNILRVEFQDYWGEVDSWETTFTGTYSGLMFKDSTGQYYSNSFGGILKYLDFDVIIAGQTTLEQKVIVQNKLGADMQNLIIESVKEKLPEGVAIQLSKTVSPFINEDYLLFNEFMYEEEEKEFYVRISTVITAPSRMNGEFELRAKVDTV